MHPESGVGVRWVPTNNFVSPCEGEGKARQEEFKGLRASTLGRVLLAHTLPAATRQFHDALLVLILLYYAAPTVLELSGVVANKPTFGRNSQRALLAAVAAALPGE